MLVPLVGGAILGNLPRIGLPAVGTQVELWYLRSYFVFALIVYFRWAFLVINSICAYLGINCLTITPKPTVTENTESKKGAAKGSLSGSPSANGRRSKKGD